MSAFFDGSYYINLKYVQYVREGSGFRKSYSFHMANGDVITSIPKTITGGMHLKQAVSKIGSDYVLHCRAEDHDISYD